MIEDLSNGDVMLNVVAPESQTHGEAYLYRHFDAAGVLLYVGVSLSAIVRLTQHRSVSPWYRKIRSVTIEHFPDRASVLEAERVAITTENPIYNTKRPRPKFWLSDRRRQLSEDSTTEVLRKVTEVRLLYDLHDVAEAIGIPVRRVKEYMSGGKIGFIELKPLNPRKKTPDIRISGWQLIEFIERLEAESKLKESVT